MCTRHTDFSSRLLTPGSGWRGEVFAVAPILTCSLQSAELKAEGSEEAQLQPAQPPDPRQWATEGRAQTQEPPIVNGRQRGLEGRRGVLLFIYCASSTRGDFRLFVSRATGKRGDSMKHSHQRVTVGY